MAKAFGLHGIKYKVTRGNCTHSWGLLLAGYKVTEMSESTLKQKLQKMSETSNRDEVNLVIICVLT